MKHYNHVIRFAIILLLIVAGFFGVRSLIVPESFGIYGDYTYGYHRGDSDREQASLPALFQGSGKCKECHALQYEQRAQAGHATVACEACHGPWQAHNENTKSQVPKEGSVEACMQCHQKLEARPAEFRQIKDFKQHMADQEMEFEDGMECIDCHDSHEPL